MLPAEGYGIPAAPAFRPADRSPPRRRAASLGSHAHRPAAPCLREPLPNSESGILDFDDASRLAGRSLARLQARTSDVNARLQAPTASAVGGPQPPGGEPHRSARTPRLARPSDGCGPKMTKRGIIRLSFRRTVHRCERFVEGDLIKPTNFKNRLQSRYLAADLIFVDTQSRKPLMRCAVFITDS